LGSAGFSLVEIISVMAIMSILAVAMPSVIGSFTSAGRLSQSASDISSVLEHARAYAMAKNTYVYVGIQEVDAMHPTSTNGVGKVAVVTVASLDGTRPYTTGALNTANIASITKPQFFTNTHIASSATLVNGANMTSRPAASIDLSSATATTSFQYPLTGPAQFSFSKVVEFDPQGVARVQTGSGFNPSVQAYIELPLVPAQGNLATANISNQAAVQVDGITGAVSVYRP
jgi:prepilin-type N-terminal cleavage/methylation domain-containing protein